MRAKRILGMTAALCASVGAARADVVTDWNEKAVALIASRGMAPAAAERIVAMTQLAMFDAVNSVQPRYHPYLVQMTPAVPASPDAAVVAAAVTVLADVAPDNAAALKATMKSALAGMPEDATKAEGVRLGEAVAAKILQARAEDGANVADAVPAAHAAGCLCADGNHRLIDVATSDAVRDDRSGAISPAAAASAGQRAMDCRL